MPEPINVFCAYAQEDQAMMLLLKKYLTPLQELGRMNLISDISIDSSEDWQKEVHERQESATLILLLISPDFLASKYCYSSEMDLALQRHAEASARVVPIILRPCYWKILPFAMLQALPPAARPISEWNSPDHAFLSIVQVIDRLLAEPIKA